MCMCELIFVLTFFGLNFIFFLFAHNVYNLGTIICVINYNQDKKLQKKQQQLSQYGENLNLYEKADFFAMFMHTLIKPFGRTSNRAKSTLVIFKLDIFHLSQIAI